MYLIVGAKGFLGSYLIKNILSMTKDEIIATDMALPEKEDNPRVKWVRCDVSNKDDIRERVGKFKSVLLGGLSSSGSGSAKSRNSMEHKYYGAVGISEYDGKR